MGEETKAPSRRHICNPEAPRHLGLARGLAGSEKARLHMRRQKMGPLPLVGAGRDRFDGDPFGGKE